MLILTHEYFDMLILTHMYLYAFIHVLIGYMTLGGRLSSNNVVPGNEAFAVHYAISNESTCTIKALDISLTEHVNYTTDHDEATSKAEAKQIKKIRIDAIEMGPGNEIAPKCRRELHDAVAPFDTLIANLNDPTNGVPITIPNNIRCSWVGHLIQITHTIEIKLVTAIGVSNPGIKFPICIHGNGNEFHAARVSFTSAGTGAKSGVSIATASDISVVPSSAPPELPDDWNDNLTIAPPVSIAIPNPRVVIIDGVDGVDTEAWPNENDITPASAPPVPISVTTEGLLEDMRGSVNEIAVLRSWATTGQGQTWMITEGVFGEIFSSLKTPHSYIEACEILGAAMRTVSVNFILHAARNVQPHTPDAIVGTCSCLARYCNDRENANILRELPLSDFMLEIVVRAISDNNA